MVGSFVGGLAQGFGQGIKLGEQLEDAKLERDYRNRMGEIAGLEARPGMRPEEFEQYRMGLFQDATAKYKPNQLPQFMYLNSALQNQAQNREAKGLEIQALKGDLNVQQQVRDLINQPTFGENPAQDHAKLLEITGDPTAAQSFLGDQAEHVNQAFGNQLAFGSIDGLVDTYSQFYPDGNIATFAQGANGGAELVIHQEGNPDNVVRRIPFNSEAELRQIFIDEVSAENPAAANAAREALASVEKTEQMSGKLYEAVTTEASNIFQTMLDARGVTNPEQLGSPELAQSLRDQAWQMALQRSYSNPYSSGGLGGGGGGGGYNIAIDPNLGAAVDWMFGAPDPAAAAALEEEQVVTEVPAGYGLTSRGTRTAP